MDWQSLPSVHEVRIEDVLDEQERANLALLLAAAEPLVSETFEPVDTAEVLLFADEHGLKTFYDASYAWLADRLGVRLFTRDREVLRACPGLATAYAD